MLYTPDLWVIVEIKYDNVRTYKKVLASWYGGYAKSDSWRLSSGITKIEQFEHHYDVHNESGSIYRCRKGANGMSGYTQGVLKNFAEQLKGTGTITIIGIDNEPKEDTTQS